MRIRRPPPEPARPFEPMGDEERDWMDQWETRKSNPANQKGPGCMNRVRLLAIVHTDKHTNHFQSGAQDHSDHDDMNELVSMNQNEIISRELVKRLGARVEALLDLGSWVKHTPITYIYRLGVSYVNLLV